jgi:hypothetical protein
MSIHDVERNVQPKSIVQNKNEIPKMVMNERSPSYPMFEVEYSMELGPMLLQGKQKAVSHCSASIESAPLHVGAALRSINATPTCIIPSFAPPNPLSILQHSSIVGD